MSGKDLSIPLKVGGWDTDFDSIGRVIEGTVMRLLDPMPAEIAATLSCLLMAVNESERQLRILTKLMELRGVGFRDDT